MEQQRNQERPAGGEADPNSCVGPASTTTTTAAPMARRSVTLAEETNLETGPGAGGGGSSSSSVPVRPTRRLLRVVVVDYPTGIALFHHSWSWKGDPNLPGVAKVIVALYKLSQSLGGRGDTNYVLFDPPPEGRRRSQQELYSLKAKRASGGAGGFRPITAMPRSRKPRIRCVFSKTDHVVVGLFHEIGDKLELPKNCADAILRTFVEQYGEKLAPMRHIFEDMIDEKKVRDCSMTQEQVLEVFSEFENSLNTIEEVGEFNRVRSAKESSSAGTYTFSFSLTDDTVELIKRERQKQREEDERNLAAGERASERRPASSLAMSSGPSESASGATTGPGEDGAKGQEGDLTLGGEGTAAPSSGGSREKKRKEKKEHGKKKEKKSKKKGKKEGKKESKNKNRKEKKMSSV